MNRILLAVAVTGVGLQVVTPVAVAGPIDLSSLNLVGASQIISGGVLRLTPNFDTNTDVHGTPIGAPPAGAAWTTTRYDVADPFAFSFDFRMSDPTGHLDNDGSGGDGIAFLIQNSTAGDTALGLGAGGMGFMYIKDSVAVMLDTYQNNYFYGDPNGNYIGVNTRGTDFNVPHHFCTKGQLTSDPNGAQGPTDLPGVPCTANPSLGMTGTLPLLDDGKVHNVTVTYVPGSLEISLDYLMVLTVGVNFADILSLEDGKDAYIGFTAGTRYSYQNQDILDFAAIPEPAAAQRWLPIAMILAMALARKRQRSRT